MRYADIEHTHTAPTAFASFEEVTVAREPSSSFVGGGVSFAADQAAAALTAARSALSPLGHFASPFASFGPLRRNLSSGSPSAFRQPTHMMLYLNDRTFVDDAGDVLQHEVREA
jgi:hypothetical protein